MYFLQEVNKSLWPAVYAKLDAFIILAIWTNAIVSTLIFLSQTLQLFIFLLQGEETAAFSAACYYCCTSTTTFPQRWSRQLVAHSLALCWQIGWRLMPTGLLSKGKKERPPLTPSHLPHRLLYAVFTFPSFLMPPSVLSAICGSRQWWRRSEVEDSLIETEEGRKDGWDGGVDPPAISVCESVCVCVFPVFMLQMVIELGCVFSVGVCATTHLHHTGCSRRWTAATCCSHTGELIHINQSQIHMMKL